MGSGAGGLLPHWSSARDRESVWQYTAIDAYTSYTLFVISRLRHDQRTREYAARRTREGRSKAKIIRCLTQYVARDVYHPMVTLDTP